MAEPCFKIDYRAIRFSGPPLIIFVLERGVCSMTDDQRELRRKLHVLEYAELSGGVSKACRYFGVGQASFYQWRHAHQIHGEPGLANNRSVPHSRPNKTPTGIEEKMPTCAASTTLGPCVSSGSWSAITGSASRMPGFIVSCVAMA